MSTLSFQRPSLLYTPPDLGSPSQKSSAADVAIGTLISFSPWDKKGKEGGGSAPSPPTPVSNSHQSQLFGIGLLWTVLMEMDSSAHGLDIISDCVFFYLLFSIAFLLYMLRKGVHVLTRCTECQWMTVLRFFFFCIERLSVCMCVFFKKKAFFYMTNVYNLVLLFSDMYPSLLPFCCLFWGWMNDI